MNSTYRLLVSLAAYRLSKEIASALREISNSTVDAEVADINVNKPYKPRRLKTDLVHKMARQIYKMKSRDPKFKRSRALYNKMYRRKNRLALDRRSKFVRQTRQQRGLN